MEIQMDPSQKQLLDDVFDAFTMLAQGNIVTLMHVEGGVTRYTPSAVELFGLPGEYIPNGAFDWAEYVHPEDRKRYLDAMNPLLDGTTHNYDLTYRVRLKDGSYAAFRVMGAALRNTAGRPSLIGGMMINEGLMGLTDPVTVLRNQYGFFADLGEKLRGGVHQILLLIGLRRLALINELHGYTFGNRVLQQAGWLMQESVGKRGAVYRMQGSTFAIMTSGISEQEAAAMYDTIRVKLQRGIRVDGIRQNLSCSGGMISTRERPMDERSLFACLRHAYRESKERRYGELVDYHGSLHYGASESMDLIHEVRNCVLDGCRGFFLDYQPVIRSDTQQIFGVESLVRWQGEAFGQVPPLDFIPILEQDFVYEELSAWILRQAMQDGLTFLERDPDFIVGVNLSPAQLEDEYFIDTLEQTASRVGFPLGNLSVELTAGCRLLEMARLKAVVADLKARGVGVIIDDFGNGVDSLGCLKALWADYVKFDRILASGIENSTRDREALRRFAELAALYGPNVCVKGVDTAGMRDILLQYPISSMQGNFYSPPIPAGKIVERFL